MSPARGAYLVVAAALVASTGACFLLTIDDSRIDAAADGGLRDGTSTGETGTPGEAGAEAGDEGGVGAWIPCRLRAPSAAHFCDDFDDPGQTVTRKWSYASLGGGGAVDGGTASLSPPASAGAFLPDLRDGGAQAALAVKLGGLATSALTLSFSVHFGASPWSGGVGGGTYFILAGVAFAPCAPANGGERQVQLIVSGTRRLRMALKCLGQQDYDTVDLTTTLDDLLGGSRWTRFDVRVAKESCPGTVGASLSAQVYAGGSLVGCSELVFDPFTALDGLTAIVGAITNGPSAPVEVDYDDVTFDQE